MSKDKEPVLVKLKSAALDDQSGEIIAHGWLDIEDIQNLRVGDYQREVMEGRSRGKSLRGAIEAGERLPDIMLGMRGQKFTSRGSDMLLENDVFVVDGLQRISALRKHAAEHPEDAKNIRIGAEVRFNTTRDSEKELFTILNVKRRAMSPSILLRNERNTSDGVATLYGLSNHDKNFAMVGKVCWDQQMHRGELLTALTFAKAGMILHRHVAAGGRNIGGAQAIPRTLDNMSKAVGLQNFRYNISNFFEVIDEVWGIRGIKYTDRATHLRGNYMNQLAGMFADHEDFWDGHKLAVDAGQKAKLKSFPIDDPTIIRLSGAGSAAGILLYRHLVDHMNKSRQASKYLVPRRPREVKVSAKKPSQRKKAA